MKRLSAFKVMRAMSALQGSACPQAIADEEILILVTAKSESALPKQRALANTSNRWD